MADILLFGPHGAGKTQLCYSLNRMDEKPTQTKEADFKGKTGGVFSRRLSIHEVGGKDMFFRDVNFLEKAFLAHERLVFVFNGNDFINELRNYQKGGFISTILRCYVMPALETSNKQKCIQFIATFLDEYSGEKGDMESEIFSCMDKANDEYREVANSMRYPFLTLLNGNLYCVDARDPKAVKELFKQIKKG